MQWLLTGLTLLLLIAGPSGVSGRTWTFVGGATPVEAEYVETRGDLVVLKGTDGKQREFPFGKYQPCRPGVSAPTSPEQQSSRGPNTRRHAGAGAMGSVRGQNHCDACESHGDAEWGHGTHVTGTGDPLPGSSINFTSANAWLFLDRIAPSLVASNLLSKFRVNGSAATLDTISGWPSMAQARWSRRMGGTSRR